jgi:hypothetical protein
MKNILERGNGLIKVMDSETGEITIEVEATEPVAVEVVEEITIEKTND